MAAVTVIDGATSVGTPSSGDSLYVLGGAASIVTNVDQSALDAGLVRVEVSKAFTGQFASAASPFKVQVSTALVYAAAAGDMYYSPDGDTGAGGSELCALLQCIGGGHFHLVGNIGTVTRAEILSGQLTNEAGVIVTNWRIAGGAVIIRDDTSTDPTNLYMLPGPGGRGGTCYTERGAGTLMEVHAGELTIAANTNTIATLSCLGARSVASTIIRHCGTITTLNALGHIPDVSQLTQLLTITNTNINASLPGAQALLDHPLITFTNTPTRYITDGRVP